METVSIALLCTVIGCVIGIGTYSKTRDKDIRADFVDCSTSVNLFLTSDISLFIRSSLSLPSVFKIGRAHV